MTSRRGSIHFLHAAAALRAAAGVCALVVATVSALAQETNNIPRQGVPPPGQHADEGASPPAAEPSNPAFKPGFIDALGRWLEEGATRLRSDMQSAQETFDKLGKEARDAAKDATGAVTTLPSARAVTARERCVPAPYGAPDCQAAANVLCRGKGFQSGRTLDTQTEQKCPARLMLSRRAPNDSDCGTEIFVTRAMCQ
jgi:hypothetical protein